MMEYCVQMREKRGWQLCSFGEPDDKLTTTDIDEAKELAARLRRKWPNSTYRLACREVVDWCECKEGRIEK